MKSEIHAATVALLVMAAGCSTLAGPAATPAPTATATDAPTPTVTATPTPTPTPTPTATEIPPTGDYDGDGVANARERELGTSPFAEDSDYDGLADGRELDLGTAPDASDTDGDGINDAVELERDGADPLRMDLYVEIVRSTSVPALTADERAALVDIFAGMAVENTDGSTGITVHLKTRTADIQPYNGKNFETIAREYDRAGEWRVVVMTRATNATLGGRGDAGGDNSVVGGQFTEPDGPTTFRMTSVVHELLHNVVGLFEDGATHTRSGWLAEDGPEAGGFKLSNMTVEHLESEGFDAAETD